MRKISVYTIIITISLAIALLAWHKYQNRFSTNLEDIFADNANAVHVVNDNFVAEIINLVNFNYIKHKYKLLNTENISISYGEPRYFNVETYGNENSIFKFVIAPQKKILLYFDISTDDGIINALLPGNTYEELKKFFGVNNSNPTNFIITPLEGDIAIEFIFDNNGTLQRVVYKNIGLH